MRNREFLIRFAVVTKDLTDAVKVLNTSLGSFSKQITGAGGKLQGLGKTSGTETKKIAVQHQSMGASITRTMIYATAAYLAFKNTIGSMVASNYELGSTLSRTNAMFKELGTSSYALSDAYLSMGRDANQFMAASTEFVRIGVRQTDTLVAMSREAWMFGEVMGLSTTEAAKMMAKISVATRLTGKDLSDLVGVSAMLRQEQNMSNAAIESTLTTMPAMTQQLGLQRASLLGLAAGFEKMGLAGTEAGNLVGKMVTMMGDPRETWKLSQLVGDVESFKNSLQGNGLTAVTQMKNALSSKPVWLLKDMTGFTEEQINAMKRAGENVDLLREIMGKAGMAAKEPTILYRLFGEATFNLKDQVEFLREELGALIMRIGSYLNPILSVGIAVFRQFLKVIALIPTPLWAIGGVITTVAIVMGAAITLAGTFVLGLALAYRRLGGAVREAVNEISDMILWQNILNMGLSAGIAETLLATIADAAWTLGKWNQILANSKLFASQSAQMSLDSAYIGILGVLATATHYLNIAKNEGIVAALIAIKTDILAAASKKADAMWSGIAAGYNWLLATSVEFCNAVKTKGIIIAGMELVSKLKNIVVSKLENAFVQRSIVLSGLLRAAKWSLTVAENIYTAIKTKGLYATLAQTAADIKSAAITNYRSAVEKIGAYWTGVKTAVSGAYVAVTESATFATIAYCASTLKSWALDRLSAAWTAIKTSVLGVYTAVLKGSTGATIASAVADKISAVWSGVKTAATNFHTLATAKNTGLMLGALVVTKATWVWDKLVAAGVYIKAAAIGFYNTFIKGSVVALAAATVAQWALNIAMDANPIGLIVLAVVALIGVFYALFRYLGIGTSAFETLGYAILFVLLGPLQGLAVAAYYFYDALAYLWNNAGKILKIINYLNPIYWIVKAMTWAFGLLWDGIKWGAGVASDALSLLLSPFSAIKSAIGWVWDNLFGSGLFGIDTAISALMGPLSIFTSAFDLIGKVAGMVKDIFKEAFTTLISVVTEAMKPLLAMFNLISSIMGLFGGEKKLDVATTPIMAAVDENKKLAVATTTSMSPAPAAAAASAGSVGGIDTAKAAPPASKDKVSPKGKGGNINITIPLTIDGEIIAQIMAKVSADQLIRHGNSPFGTMRGIPG